jgi:hypothetical protein
VVGAKRSDEIEAMVDALEELPDIVQLTRLLGTGRRSQA